jgi:hypothetical protein
MSICVGRAGGLEGGPIGPPSRGVGGRSPPRGGSGAAPSKKKIQSDILPGRHISGTT